MCNIYFSRLKRLNVFLVTETSNKLMLKNLSRAQLKFFKLLKLLISNKTIKIKISNRLRVLADNLTVLCSTKTLNFIKMSARKKSGHFHTNLCSETGLYDVGQTGLTNLMSNCYLERNKPKMIFAHGPWVCHSSREVRITFRSIFIIDTFQENLLESIPWKSISCSLCLHHRAASIGFPEFHHFYSSHSIYV